MYGLAPVSLAIPQQQRNSMHAYIVITDVRSRPPQHPETIRITHFSETNLS